MSELELCKKMYVYAIFSCKKTEEKKCSEIKALLAEFFDEELIKKARRDLFADSWMVKDE